MIRNKSFRGGEEAEGVPQMIDFLANGNLSLLETLLQNMSFTNEGHWYMTSEMNESWAKDQSMFIPPIALNDTDNARVSDIGAVLDPFRDQAMVEFITGVRNIANNNDWNAYLAELDRLGSAELAAILQKYIR
jgi:hypothetical protein